MSDWFSQQLKPTPVSEEKPGADVSSTKREGKHVALSVQNNTFHQWSMVIGCIVSNGSSEGTIEVPPLIIQPNDSASHRINRRILMTEQMCINSIECIAPLSDTSGLVLHQRNPILLPFHAIQKMTTIVVTIDWKPSTTLYGHCVPTMEVETISMSQVIP